MDEDGRWLPRNTRYPGLARIRLLSRGDGVQPRAHGAADGGPAGRGLIHATLSDSPPPTRTPHADLTLFRRVILMPNCRQKDFFITLLGPSNHQVLKSHNSEKTTIGSQIPSWMNLLTSGSFGPGVDGSR